MDELPPLPAAIEVAAYRIVSEAMTNVVKHANAALCDVTLKVCEGALRVGVEDDGAGLPEGYRSGVGLQSMRERAEELGGRFEVRLRDGGGTRVSATLRL